HRKQGVKKIKICAVVAPGSTDPVKRLSVNLDHVATLREQRHTPYPDLTRAADLARAGGADGITLHLRGDRRHIQESDLAALSGGLLPVTLEIACTPENMEILRKYKPFAVTFVPERPEELTTEGGMNLSVASAMLARLIPEIRSLGIRVCLFLEPDEKALRLAKDLGATMVEIHTGGYAEGRVSVEEILQAADAGDSMGLEINAGHGLTVENARRLGQGKIHEFSIGHSIICRSVMVGLEEAVREMKAAIQG
ncbi:MAG TPA: pyridoxine 5'-phosphate synthase, partial [Leptospiraceae bacterium]|nr:pyridoxine 5'-phosphate synthase [Leptospiraceae bacterium]